MHFAEFCTLRLNQLNVALVIIIIIIYAHQHKATDMKIKLSIIIKCIYKAQDWLGATNALCQLVLVCD